MRSTFSGFNTVVSGLQMQQLCLDTVGHNISNANTTGYSKQTVNLVTKAAQPVYTGAGMVDVGTGVTAASITRARDALIDAQYWKQNSSKNYYQNQTDTLSQMEDIFSDSSTSGISYAISQFSTALGTLASNASDSSARTNVRETASSLVEALNEDSQQLVGTANDLTKQIQTQVTQINSYASQIAALNQQIVNEQASGVDANDLMDQRDNLVDQMSALTNVNVTEDKSGAYTVSIGSGVTLVQGNTAQQLTVNTDKNALYGYTTTSVTCNNTAVNFTDGSIASLTNLRDSTVNGYLGNLDSIAKFFLQDFNAQYNQGYDNESTPTAGANFFGVSGTNYSSVDPTTGTPPQSWLSQLTVNSKLYGTNGLDLIAARGSATGGSADGTNATAMANLLTGTPSITSAAIGKNSLADYYASVVSALGVQSQQASNLNTNQGVMLTSTSNWRDSVSGVSTDEELSNMIKFQEAYGACAKVMSTMGTMLDSLLSATTSATS